MEREDSYWYVDEQDKRMKAMCKDCQKIHNIGWYWPGKQYGYGDYDLNCAICGKTIHKRDDANKD